jgi:hypothetical protein
MKKASAIKKLAVVLINEESFGNKKDSSGTV